MTVLVLASALTGSMLGAPGWASTESVPVESEATGPASAGSTQSPSEVVANPPSGVDTEPDLGEVAVAVSAPDRPAGGPGAPAADGELVALRTETSRTFVTAEGLQARIWTEPVNVRDEQGLWQPIDPVLVEAPANALRNRRGPADVRLPGSLAEPVRITGPKGASVGFRLEGARGDAQRSAAGSRATYRGALPGVDVRYETTATGVKEDLLLASPAAPSSFRFALELSPGLRAAAVDGGGLLIADAAGTAVFEVPAPTVTDSSGTPEGFSSSAVTYRLEGPETAPTLTVALDPAWLADPVRVFPVAVDPTTELVSPAASTHLSKTAPTTNFAGASVLRIGQSGSRARRFTAAW